MEGVVDGALFINLDSRPDRREEIEAECRKYDIAAERVQACTPEGPPLEGWPGWYQRISACARSHMKALTLALERGWASVLILEDDFVFEKPPSEVRAVLCRAMLEVPFEVLMLSWNNLSHAAYNSYLGKCVQTQTASGYIVRRHFFRSLIAVLQSALDHGEPFDVYWFKKQCEPGMLWLYVLDRLGKQRPSMSNITGKFEDYGV